MFKEFFAKDANNKFLHNQDTTCQHASMLVVALFVKIGGISDMSAQTAVLQFSTDLQTVTFVELYSVKTCYHVIITQLEKFQEVAITFNFQKVSSHIAATGSVAANLLSSNVEMTSVQTFDYFFLFK